MPTQGAIRFVNRSNRLSANSLRGCCATFLGVMAESFSFLFSTPGL